MAINNPRTVGAATSASILGNGRPHITQRRDHEEEQANLARERREAANAFGGDLSAAMGRDLDPERARARV